MIDFFEENKICPDCNYYGPHDKDFEKLWGGREGEEQIIFICPECDLSTVHGTRYEGEEFYF